jgi:hypothetical protein
MLERSNSVTLKWVKMRPSWSGFRHYPTIRLDGMNKQDPFSRVRILTECFPNTREFQLTFRPHGLYRNTKSWHLQKDKFQETSSSHRTITIHTNSHRWLTVLTFPLSMFMANITKYFFNIIEVRHFTANRGVPLNQIQLFTGSTVF